MANLFNSVKTPKPVKSNFKMGYRNLISCNAGKVIPFYFEETVPTDVWKCRTNAFVRLAPLAVPAFVDYEVFMTYFKVPRRICEPTFDYFLSGGTQGTSIVESTCISLYDYQRAVYEQVISAAPGSLADYLGYPTDAGTLTVSSDVTQRGSDVPVDLFPVYAYQIIMDEYFADQNLSDPYVTVNADGSRRSLRSFIDDGDWPDLFSLRRGCYRKDGFLSSALPFAHRGPAVSVGGTVSPFEVEVSGEGLKGSSDDPGVIRIDEHGYVSGTSRPDSGQSDAILYGQTVSDSGSMSVSLEDLRQAIKILRWYETNGRAGSRLPEMILSHFGIKPKDYRLQRPELVGGGKFHVGVYEVLQTSATEVNNPLGSYAGKGIAQSSAPFGRCFVEEHGCIIGLMLIRPRLITFEGLSRHLTKTDRFEFPWPEFEGLGEQEIKTYEVNVFSPDSSGSHTLNDVFGYAPRYWEFKSHPDEIHGSYRTSLRAWHMGRTFGANKPVLNNSFMQVPDDNHIFAVTSDNVEHFYCCFDSQVYMNRPFHTYSVPSGLV